MIANLFGAGLALYVAETLEKRRREKAELSRLYLPADEEALLEEDAADGLAAGGINNGTGTSSGGYPPFTLEDSDSEDEAEGDARRLPGGKR